MKSLFIKNVLRDSTPIMQPNFNIIIYDHNTIRYQHSNLWSNLLNNVKMSNGPSSFKNTVQN